MTNQDPDLCPVCGLFKRGPDVQGDACPGHRPSEEAMRRKIEALGDDEPAIIGAGFARQPPTATYDTPNWKLLVTLLRDPRCMGRHDLMADAAKMIERLVGHVEQLQAASACVPSASATNAAPQEKTEGQGLNLSPVDARGEAPAVAAPGDAHGGTWVHSARERMLVGRAQLEDWRLRLSQGDSTVRWDIENVLMLGGKDEAPNEG